MSDCKCSGSATMDWSEHGDYCPVYMKGRIKQLEDIIKISNGLSCPNCDNEGYTAECDGYGGAYQQQCEFCYTVGDSVFNRKQALLKGEGDE